MQPTSESTLSHTPVLTPDGKFWWNGASWSPMPDVLLPSKNKVTAGLLAIFLGGLGIHKFYLGQVLLGILYLLFSATAIPLILGIIEGILYLFTPDEQWFLRYPPLTVPAT